MASDIVAMRRVSAYKTADDKLHDTRDEAIRHQARLDLTQLLDGTVACGDREDSEEVAGFLLDHADAVIAILKASTKGFR